MRHKRTLLPHFRHDELQQAVHEYQLDVADRRVRDDLEEAIAGARRVKLPDLLHLLPLRRLKDIASELEMRHAGIRKDVLVARIAGLADPEQEGASTSSSKKSAAGSGKPKGALAALQELLATTLVVSEPGNGWPAKATLHYGGAQLPVEIYVRPVGGSGRDRPLERRFQNPASRTPIEVPEAGYALLLGVWTEQGTERGVIAAMDAYQRVGREKRFSMFVPLSLLEDAADTGFGTHTTTSGEVVYAFRPESLGRYLDVFFREASWGSHAVPRTTTRAARRARKESESAIRMEEIHIRPKVGMYGAFARLNYKPWYALAEFVDNSIQSYLNNRSRLEKRGVEGPLIVDVRIDDHQISVTDRAGGIAIEDFPRAFSPSTRPPDPSGLSEFGLGMKAAACWFSQKWSVRTSALDEKLERTVSFDVPKIVAEGSEDLPIESRETRNDDHFTVISLTDLRVRPKGRTIHKIKTHLASMYRLLIKDGIVKIRLTSNGVMEELSYEQPDLLVAPHHAEPNGREREWRAELDVPLKGGKRVSGWAGIMAKGKASVAGFAVFRRRRLIQGSVGEAYRPHAIFGSSNSFAYQRVVGELYVEGFNVSHTKDGIQWGGLEEEIIQSIRKQIDTKAMPLLEQAAKYRARKKGGEVRRGFGRSALRETAAALNATAAKETISEQIRQPPPAATQPATEPSEPPRVVSQQSMRMEVSDAGQSWQVNIELIDSPGAEWFETSRRTEDGNDIIDVQINLSHPFSEAHLNDNEKALGPLVRVVAAMALSEHAAREAGMRETAWIRSDANELLRRVFSEAEIVRETDG